MNDRFDANQRRWDDAVDNHLGSTTGACHLALVRAGVDALTALLAQATGQREAVAHVQGH